ncbi:MAG: CDP-glycerol:poly(glycerophosphate) glycerophosphotransferase, partial [uncultured Solirubrobacteraceae bacterium]
EDRLQQLRGPVRGQSTGALRGPSRPRRRWPPRAPLAGRSRSCGRLSGRRADRGLWDAGGSRRAAERGHPDRKHPYGCRVDQARRRRLPADVARHAAEADPLGRHVGAGGAAGAVVEGRRSLGLPDLAQPDEHAAAAPRLSLRPRRRRDRLSAQRRPQRPRPRRAARGPARRARDRRRQDGRALRADLARRRGVRRGRQGVSPRLRHRRVHRAARRRPRPAAAPALHAHGALRARRASGGARRVLSSRHRSAVPRRRRSRHRLLVDDVRLRDHGPPDPVLHLRPRRLPGTPAGLLLRLRTGRARSAAGHDAGRAGCAARPGRRQRAPRGALCGVSRAVLPPRGRPCQRACAGRAVRGGGGAAWL